MRGHPRDESDEDMTILLADDHGLYRESVKRWLEAEDMELRIETVSDYASVADFLATGARPRLLMLDLCMPGMHGVSGVRQLHRDWPDVPILVVSANDDPLVIKGCLEAGAAGFVSKTVDGDELLAAVRRILAGGTIFPRHALHSPMPDFSAKQTKILYLLAEGLSNREIANECHLSEGTVKQYVSDILAKLDVDNRVQAGLRAREILGLASS